MGLIEENDADADPDSKEYIELNSKVDDNGDNIVGKKQDLLQRYPDLRSDDYTVIPSKIVNANVIKYLIDT